MRVNIFDDYDRVINHQSNGRRDAAQSHQIKAQPSEIHGQKCSQHRHRDHQNRNEGCSPVSQKGEQDHH